MLSEGCKLEQPARKVQAQRAAAQPVTPPDRLLLSLSGLASSPGGKRRVSSALGRLRAAFRQVN
ncbi:MAG: hypothetical protein JO316_10120 [Abitibacteriaceae bacterium]|nr:hypothetical protein [Abditibacteriaceae bacterium]